MKRVRLNKIQIKALIRKHGSAYKAAKALGITPQAFYERMKRLRIPRTGYPLRPGEPRQKCAKVAWLRGLVGKKSVGEVARELGCSQSAVRARMSCYRILLRPPVEARVKSLKKLLEKYKTGYAVAKVLQVTPQAVYDRISRHGL
jgi:predicted transcriptional regulator